MRQITFISIICIIGLLAGIVGVGAAIMPTLPAPKPQTAVPLTEPAAEKTSTTTHFATSEFAPIMYGINFINEVEHPASQDRLTKARTTLAAWDRFPIYWHNVERTPGQYDWSAVDQAVLADLQNGFLIDAILMGIPQFYFDGGRAVPSSLNAPIFTDGSDTPGDGKQINPDNKWATYVHNAVKRYSPYGTWATAHGLPDGAGITHWEIWNEPDLPSFWSGSTAEYARLLKVAYYAARVANPSADIMFGATANNHAYPLSEFYANVMAQLDTDPAAPAEGYYHTAMATHSYHYAWASWYHVDRTKRVMAQYGIDHPIWLNESGIPLWDDYPGSNWDPNSPHRGSVDEQADYMVQSAFYALYAGATGYFHFQMYDGCGNQPAGTDFPPHNGNLCTADGSLTTDNNLACYGDAFGLFRNETDAMCFTQHPEPGTARPQLETYQFLTQYLQGVVPLSWARQCAKFDESGNMIAQDDQVWISFYRPDTNQRIMAVWSCKDDQNVEAIIPPIDAEGARLFTPQGELQPIQAGADGNYHLTLPPATNDNQVIHPWRWPVGGRPYILIERDSVPPEAGIGAYPAGEETTDLIVDWWGNDYGGGGIDALDVMVSVDGGPFEPWLTNTREVSAVWTGDYENSVEFSVQARDNGGNTSPVNTFLYGTGSLQVVYPLPTEPVQIIIDQPSDFVAPVVMTHWLYMPVLTSD